MESIRGEYLRGGRNPGSSPPMSLEKEGREEEGGDKEQRGDYWDVTHGL